MAHVGAAFEDVGGVSGYLGRRRKHEPKAVLFVIDVSVIRDTHRQSPLGRLSEFSCTKGFSV